MSRFTVLSKFVLASAALFACVGICALSAAAQTENILYNFASSKGDVPGYYPWSDLVIDSDGNIYGMTSDGGVHGSGTVFELSPASGGGWTTKVLHAFGAFPDGGEALSGPTMDSAGNLYGATAYGGSGNFGIIFQLVPNENGSWSEKILHTFVDNGKDGLLPTSDVTLDAAGNVYGTTSAGGAENAGIVFELSPHSGSWTEKVLYTLPNPQHSSNASQPVTFDSAGNLYGVTLVGGSANEGFVFELTPTASGPWKAREIYTFGDSGAAPNTPLSSVIFDAAGNLYGSTYRGGTGNVGVVYELSPTAGGGWSEQTIYSFPSACSTGCQPNGRLIFDPSGNLYGAALQGGQYERGGVFELSPSAGTWTENALHQFGGADDGIFPRAGLLRDSLGNLYGTTNEGGTDDGGILFEITP